MTIRLMQVALADWERFDGYAAGHNMPDIRLLPLERATAFIYWLVTKDADQQAVDRWRAKLWRPPTKATPIPERSPWSASSEMRAFGAFAAQVGGTRPAQANDEE